MKHIPDWWYTYPSEKYESQIGVWHSQYMESHKIHVPNHQPDTDFEDSKGSESHLKTMLKLCLYWRCSWNTTSSPVTRLHENFETRNVTWYILVPRSPRSPRPSQVAGPALPCERPAGRRLAIDFPWRNSPSRPRQKRGILCHGWNSWPSEYVYIYIHKIYYPLVI